jgi:hypothetical protein
MGWDTWWRGAARGRRKHSDACPRRKFGTPDQRSAGTESGFWKYWACWAAAARQRRGELTWCWAAAGEDSSVATSRACCAAATSRGAGLRRGQTARRRPGLRAGRGQRAGGAWRACWAAAAATGGKFVGVLGAWGQTASGYFTRVLGGGRHFHRGEDVHRGEDAWPIWWDWRLARASWPQGIASSRRARGGDPPSLPPIFRRDLAPYCHRRRRF